MKRRKSKSTKPYSGYMKFPLLGANNYAEFQSTTEYSGDLLIPERRVKIFSKPRNYRVEVWLNIAATNEYDRQDLNITSGKISLSQLSKILFEYAIKGLQELVNEAETVDLCKSYFKVILN